MYSLTEVSNSVYCSREYIRSRCFPTENVGNFTRKKMSKKSTADGNYTMWRNRSHLGNHTLGPLQNADYQIMVFFFPRKSIPRTQSREYDAIRKKKKTIVFIAFTSKSACLSNLFNGLCASIFVLIIIITAINRNRVPYKTTVSTHVPDSRYSAVTCVVRTSYTYYAF
jgi:hypothetical protein